MIACVSPPPPANPPERGLEDPSQTAVLKSEEGPRGWEAPGPREGKDDLALTGSCKVTVRRGRPSRTQCRVTGSPGLFPGVKTEEKLRGSWGT